VEAEKAKIYALQFFVDNSKRDGKGSAGQGHNEQQPASGSPNSSKKDDAQNEIQEGEGERKSGAAKESGAKDKDRITLKFIFMYNERYEYTDSETGLTRSGYPWCFLDVSYEHYKAAMTVIEDGRPRGDKAAREAKERQKKFVDAMVARAWEEKFEKLAQAWWRHEKLAHDP